MCSRLQRAVQPKEAGEHAISRAPRDWRKTDGSARSQGASRGGDLRPKSGDSSRVHTIKYFRAAAIKAVCRAARKAVGFSRRRGFAIVERITRERTRCPMGCGDCRECRDSFNHRERCRNNRFYFLLTKRSAAAARQLRRRRCWRRDVAIIPRESLYRERVWLTISRAVTRSCANDVLRGNATFKTLGFSSIVKRRITSSRWKLK